MIAGYAIANGLFEVLKPKTKMTVSEWAEKYRVLPPSGTDAAGPWRNSRTPYLVEIMDALSVTSRADEVVLCKGAQIGGSEGGLNWLMYLIDHAPGPILALQPSDGDVADWSKQRVGPSLARCERIRDKMLSSKGGEAGSTIFQKEFTNGSVLFLSGTRSSRALSSKPIGNLYFDEVDRYVLNVDGEGDPIELAKQRIANFSRAKTFYSSTPTLMSTSRIWPLYQDSDRRVYELPCPYCGHYQALAMEQLKWEEGDPDSVLLLCEHCSSLIDESHKTKMLKNGRWRATNPGHWRVGFHLSALYSPVGWLSWKKIARRYEAAKGDTEKMTTFVNTVLGLPWEEDAESIAADYLNRRKEKYEAMVPGPVLMLTLTVDVQNDRLECEVVGWGEAEESWGIEYRVFRGDTGELVSNDPDRPTVWQMLDEYRKTKFPSVGGVEMGISCVLIDSGGSHTDTVYHYTRPRERERVFSIKGGSQPSMPLLNKPVRRGRCYAALFVLGVDKGKELVFGRLKIDTPGPGYCHFPDDENRGYDGHYYAGLISEQRVIERKNGKRVVKWKLPKGAHNEQFDLRVYNTAAIRIMNPNWAKLKEQKAQRMGVRTQAVPIAAIQPTRLTSMRPSPPPAPRASTEIKLIKV